ncbi:MAG: hypothetical protein Q9160_004666 [Pyrenula sp. 1 TL-2023]
MKLSFATATSALVAVATATDHWQSVWCTDGGQKETVTVTTTVTQTEAPTSIPSPPPPPATATDSLPAPHHTFEVIVGAAGKNIYNPDRLDNVKKDDVIVFTFLAKNHTLTQSNFNTPCTFNGGFDTGFNQFNPKNDSNAFKIPFTVPDDTKPLWFYCRQQGHCPQGMVFGINTQGKMDEFIAKAKATNGTAPPPPGSTGTLPPPPGSTGTTPPNAIQTVTVGLDKGKTLRFDPPFLQNIKRGSIVHFDFRAANHTLTESTFDKPCTKLVADGTIDTNFDHANKDDVPNLKPFDFTFPDDKPRYFYCKQANGTPNGHCGKGMVFALNVDQNRFNDFKKNAEATLPKVKGRAPELGWQH